MPLFLSLYLKKSFYISFSLSVFIFFYMLQMEIYVLEKIVFNSSSKGQGHVCIYMVAGVVKVEITQKTWVQTSTKIL